MRYAFVKGHHQQFNVHRMCSMLTVHPNAFYAWLKRPFSKRSVEDERQTALLKEAWEDGGKVYGYRKLHDDLQDQGESCCPNRVARLTRMARIKGSQFTSIDWASFLKQHNREHSMSPRGNCHDNAVAESFFNLLKRERVRRRTYETRDDERQDIFDHIEMFYNPQRNHARNGMLSPIEFETRQKLNPQSVYKSRGYSQRHIAQLNLKYHLNFVSLSSPVVFETNGTRSTALENQPG
jgi:putative transposase